MRPSCRHCRVNVSQPGKRGLCLTCYTDLGIRCLYPSQQRSGPHDHEPSAEEIEALVAEQSLPENLPDWFHQDRRFKNRVRTDR